MYIYAEKHNITQFIDVCGDDSGGGGGAHYNIRYNKNSHRYLSSKPRTHAHIQNAFKRYFTKREFANTIRRTYIKKIYIRIRIKENIFFT